MINGSILKADFEFDYQFGDLFNDIPNFILANEVIDDSSLFDNNNKLPYLFEFPHENHEFLYDQMNSL